MTSGHRDRYQDLALCDNLTAAANVFLGREVHAALGPIPIAGPWRHGGARRCVVRRTEIETRPRELVRQMSGGQRQAVAIAPFLNTLLRRIELEFLCFKGRVKIWDSEIDELW